MRSCIALAYTLCFLAHGVASAAGGNYDDEIASIEHYLQLMNSNLGSIEGYTYHQQDIYKILHGESAFDRYANPRTGTLPWYLLQIAQQNQYSKEILQNISRNMTNVSSSSSTFVTNFVNVSVQPTNIVHSSFDPTIIVTNVVSGGGSFVDVLAGNPWWVTNSEFAALWSMWDNKAPRPTSRGHASFPELISMFSSSFFVSEDAGGSSGHDFFDGLRYARDSWIDQFGVTSKEHRNYDEGAYSFVDYVADAFRSNLAIVTTYGTNELVNMSDSTGAEEIIDTGDTTNTNVLDELSLSRADTDAISGLTDYIDADDVGDMFGELDVTPDPQLRIFPGGQYGDVTVDAVYADFTLPDNVATMITTVARWLWHILVMVSLFVIVRQEFDYWSTLGGSASA